MAAFNHSFTFRAEGADYAPSVHQATLLARAVFAEVLRSRRISGSKAGCTESPCPSCEAPHLPKIVSAILQGRPITFVLPAFPGKSPNLAKVLGTLPDLAEQRALEFLQDLAERIGEIYAPGARILLCSDGRVFSDVVGMRDEDVSAYQDELSRMITEGGLTHLSQFHLENLYAGLTFDQMRAQLMLRHGASAEALQASVSRGKSPEASPADQEMHRLYCGITRFLFEDALTPGQTQSRASIQRDSRARAYQVIQRSQAWSELIETHFDEAVRLSIHPHGCGSKKLGIKLIEPDQWQTPWHGVAVEADGKTILLKRAEAERLGARLVMKNGRPSHYVLDTLTSPAPQIGVAHAL